MHRYGIEDEYWFAAARTGLERRGFRLRIQPRSIIIDKEARLPRIVGGAREFLEFAERQGLPIDQAAFQAADRYGDSRSDLRGRNTASPFETPPPDAPIAARAAEDGYRSAGDVLVAAQPPALSAELQATQQLLAAERQAVQALSEEKLALQARCAQLEADVGRLTAMAGEAAQQRDLWQMSAAAAEDRLRLLQAELDAPASGRRGADRRFDQLRRYLARELHPDLAGENMQERALREALFKRVWAKIEQLQ